MSRWRASMKCSAQVIRCASWRSIIRMATNHHAHQHLCVFCESPTGQEGFARRGAATWMNRRRSRSLSTPCTSSCTATPRGIAPRRFRMISSCRRPPQIANAAQLAELRKQLIANLRAKTFAAFPQTPCPSICASSTITNTNMGRRTSGTDRSSRLLPRSDGACVATSWAWRSQHLRPRRRC